MRRLPKWARGLAGLVVAALVASGIFLVTTAGPPEMTITAEFATAPGLYVGNQVKILGMPVGSVTKITPGATYVTVEMQVPASTKIPADAQAFLMAPQIVNDRYVQLNPAYVSGPRLSDHAVIPVARTATAISLDTVIDSLDKLATALGPSGANAHGALSAFVDSLAHAFGSNGADLHSTLDNLGSALAALSAHSPQLTALFDNLGNLSHTASQYTSTYQAFANDLAAVSTELASDNSDIGSALANLQRALGTLAEFVRTNSSALGKSVDDLDTFASAVAAKQQQLAQVFGNLPIALDNLGNAVDPNASGGPALVARLDLMGDSSSYSKAVCGNALLRLLLISVDQSQDKDSEVDLDCGVNGLLAGLPTPPGASSGPNLSLSALVGGAP
ncbi:MAG: MCE family protein [Acidimicrobiales bacterium]